MRAPATRFPAIVSIPLLLGVAHGGGSASLLFAEQTRSTDDLSKMPLTTTHALVPLAGAIVFLKRPVPWRIITAATLAAAAPDLDFATNPIWGVQWGLSPLSVYAHRGATHSLFVALAAGLLAAIFHKQLRVRPLTGAMAVGIAMASHGLLDMFTDFGLPVAYLWPVSSTRLFADWRPIHSAPVIWGHLVPEVFARQSYELWHIIVPMFTIALTIRIGRIFAGQLLERRKSAGR
jgi:inner membrane protein